ncbi:MAG TPA: class IV adenylate cyclase [Bryobacteraceae bacterium]|nr:class IV adenylate cyclase [Bryobacteraceae bacterium]
MRSPDSKREIEIKLRVSSGPAARRLLRAAAFRVLRRRVFEDNLVFDTRALSLRQAGILLRLRQAGKTATLTYKGPPEPGRHKSREELELELPDAARMALILERLGFHRVFRYQKFRTEYAESGARGVVTVDETPIGWFLEIEGTPRWIDRTARRLGFRESDYITASYGGLYFEFCRERGITSGENCLFPAHYVKHGCPRGGIVTRAGRRIAPDLPDPAVH